jgi:glycosyltransferase involved in cell wall biosynthesis
MKPLISVVLPVYNVEKYIKECMDSILNQTLQDFEVLVIDDSSTDNTLKIIESYKDSRIVIIKKETNRGLVSSLNLGFEVARGKYIARVDGDDINALDRFQKQIQFLELNKHIDICGSALKLIDENECKIVTYPRTDEEIKAKLLISCSIAHPTIILRKEAFYNINYDINYKHAEDYELWSRIIETHRFYNLQEVLYYYRVHEEQVSLLFKKQQLANDISIKLRLFKKINYNQNKYSEKLLVRIMYSSEYFNITELHIFILWTKSLLKNNKCYDDKQLKEVVNQIIRKLVHTIYFLGSRKNINKFWRLRALFVLPFKELVFIIRKKMK